MIVNTSLDEVKKRENALFFIKQLVENKGRNFLYDLTGLSGGFLVSDKDLNLLETYVGPAIFEEKLQKEGIKHLGGEKVLPLNRTSSGILASILSLVDEDSYVVHYLPKLPAHPSIPRSCKLVKANYLEFDKFNEFYIPDNTSLVVITGSTMDHQVIDETIFKKIIDCARKRNIPVLVDDASGARVRTVIYNQSKATDLGANLVITSTDKLMPGPRGGLMAGDEDLINKIKVKANQFGLEAQSPLILAMVNGLKNFSEDNLKKGFSRKYELMELLKTNFKYFELTPTGVMITPSNLKKELSFESVSQKDLAFAFAMVLLKDYGIITIPAVSMPGASATIRLDLSANDALNLDLNELYKNIVSSISKLSDNEESLKKIIFH